MSKFDSFIGRASSVAQVVLVFVAIYTLYFTAIPLYQKELASEQLAKIQIEQMAAEERLSFVNASYNNQLGESEVLRKQNELLAARLKLEQQYLSEIESQVKAKDGDLNKLRLALSKTNDAVRASEDRLANVGRLRFIQSVEWYASTLQLSPDCEFGLVNRNASRGKDGIRKCSPLVSIETAIKSASQVGAKDQSGDLLGLSESEAEKWTSRAVKLVSEHKDLLSDVMDESRFDFLVSEVRRYKAERDSKKTPTYDPGALNADLALISYESEIAKKRMTVIGAFVEILKSKL